MVFGAGTEATVIAFQKKYGLTTDGIAGNDTLNKIKEVLSNKGNSDTKSTESGTVRNVPINNNYKNKNVNVENAKYVYNELIKSELFNKVTLNPENAENRLSFLNK